MTPYCNGERKREYDKKRERESYTYIGLHSPLFHFGRTYFLVRDNDTAIVFENKDDKDALCFGKYLEKEWLKSSEFSLSECIERIAF